MTDIREEVTVMTAGAADMLACWAEAWTRSGNEGWRVWIGDGGMPDAQRARFQRDGFELFDMVEAESSCVGTFGKKHSTHHALWASKVHAIAKCPTRWCFWLDHDAEVRGDITPIVEHGLSLGKWLSAPKYASMPAKRFPGKRVAQNGMMLVDTGDSDLLNWMVWMEQYNAPNDETALPHLYGGFDAADADIGDLYRPEWYVSCDCFHEVHQSIAQATEKVRTAKAVVRHWCAPAGKRMFKRLYAEVAA